MPSPLDDADALIRDFARRTNLQIAGRPFRVDLGEGTALRGMLTALGAREVGSGEAPAGLLTVGPDGALFLEGEVLPDRGDAGGRIDGLIGQDVLANEIYSLDYRRRVIVWHAEGDVLEGERIVVIARNNRLLVRLPQRAHDSHPIELIPDSGAAGVVVFAHAAGKLRFTMHEIGVLSSVSATRVARRITIEDLVIGDTHLRQHTAAMVPDSRPAGLLGDGLLPLHLFSRVTFNVAEGFVIFQQR